MIWARREVGLTPPRGIAGQTISRQCGGESQVLKLEQIVNLLI
jgi:hypothetical protein